MRTSSGEERPYPVQLDFGTQGERVRRIGAETHAQELLEAPVPDLQLFARELVDGSSRHSFWFPVRAGWKHFDHLSAERGS